MEGDERYIDNNYCSFISIYVEYSFFFLNHKICNLVKIMHFKFVLSLRYLKTKIHNKLRLKYVSKRDLKFLLKYLLVLKNSVCKIFCYIVSLQA